jgi:hypothetical protein
MAVKETYQLRAESFELGSDRPGDSEAQAQARAYLRRLMREYPKGVPGKRKRDFRNECAQQFGTSDREFERIWRDEIARLGAIGWRKRGPRGPRRARKN